MCQWFLFLKQKSINAKGCVEPQGAFFEKKRGEKKALDLEPWKYHMCGRCDQERHTYPEYKHTRRVKVSYSQAIYRTLEIEVELCGGKPGYNHRQYNPPATSLLA